jgi:hypothetical protein
MRRNGSGGGAREKRDGFRRPQRRARGVGFGGLSGLGFAGVRRRRRRRRARVLGVRDRGWGAGGDAKLRRARRQLL